MLNGWIAFGDIPQTDGHLNETSGITRPPHRYTMQSPQLAGRFMHLRSRGFTLMELMIVVAIVAILAAIAYPSFMEQVRASRRADALAEAGRIQLAMERWRADNPSYETNAINGGTYPVPADTATYDFELSAQSATTYTLLAEAIGSQASDRCGDLTATITDGIPTITWATASCN